MTQCHCVQCDRDFVRQRRRGNLTACARCSKNARWRAWAAKNRERIRQYPGYGGTAEAKARYAKSERGKATAREKAKRWYHKGGQGAALSRKHYAENRDECIQKVVERSAKIARATPRWADLDLIAKIYRDARQFSRAVEDSFHVDHIVPLRGDTVNGLHVPWNLRIVHAEVNRAKSNALTPMATAEV